jgi:predicted acylesterase/phospholipase RssA
VLHTIEYDGIGMQHLMTSMSSHLKYKYPSLQASTNGSGKQERQFWDGVYLSNTPLRELLQAHRNYWFKTKGVKDDVPDLEIYIIDLYPTMEKEIPQAADEIQDRQYDILFHDRTKYDEKVARMVSDYINLSRDLIALAKKKGASEAEMDSILDKDAKSMSRSGINRQYRDLLDGRFEILRLVRIERSEDLGDDIVGKAFDFSTKTIDQLRDQGYKDALAQV